MSLRNLAKTQTKQSWIPEALYRILSNQLFIMKCFIFQIDQWKKKYDGAKRDLIIKTVFFDNITAEIHKYR